MTTDYIQASLVDVEHKKLAEAVLADAKAGGGALTPEAIAAALGYTPADAAAVVTGSGAAGQVAVFSGTMALTGDANLTWDSDTSYLQGVTALNLRSDPAYGSTIQLGSNGVASIGNGNGSCSVSGDGASVNSSATSFSATNSPPLCTWQGAPLVPASDNLQDLGGVTATIGQDQRLRTGYFGTSVVTPDVVMSSGAASVIIFPTVDANVVGAWWNNSGVLTLSSAT